MMGYMGDMMWGGLVWGLLGFVSLVIVVGAITYVILEAHRAARLRQSDQ